MASHKKLASLVFLLALAGSVVAWSSGPFPAARPVPVTTLALVQNQPLDMSEWKAYRNEELRFTIQLPPRWETDYTIEVKETIGKGFGSVAFSKPTTLTNTYTGEKTSYDYMVFSISAVTKEWWEKELSYDQPHPGFLGKNNDKVYIYISGQDNDQREHEEIKRIIKSFEVYQPFDTSEWKTYRNEELGFTIKLPPRWEADYTIEVKTWNRNGYLKSVSFSHKVDTGINPYTKERVIEDYKIFFIAMVTKEWWEKDLSYEQPHPGIIREINDRVYIYGVGHDTETLERKEIRALLSTFEVIE